MRQLVFLIALACIPCITLSAQLYSSKSGRVSFVSEAPLEKIEASNASAYVVFDPKSGRTEWSVLIRGFAFEKALMQDHFNENYMESHKYPKGLFKGAVVNMHEIDLDKNGTYPADVRGDITLHGITRPIEVKGRLTVRGDQVTATASFFLTIADFEIKVPKVVRENIAKTVEINVSADLQKMK